MGGVERKTLRIDALEVKIPPKSSNASPPR
jgi:hypothetical protein